MPRPAPKRNRSTKAPKPNNTAKLLDQHGSRASKSPPAERGPTLDPTQALRSQTPLTKNFEHAIESSPVGDRPDTGSRPGTGSRPPTRSRGYSSTLSFAGRKGDTSSRIPGTPAFESSVLSNFRRRPRQQSILQMMQAEDGSSDLDDEDFLGGLSPEDESTPLNLSRGKSLLVRRAEQSPSESLASSGGSRKRKRDENVQVPESPCSEVIEDTPSATPIRLDQASHVSEATPRALPQFPDVLSQTMAPPDSSPAVSNATDTQNSIERGDLEELVYLSTATLQDKLLPRRRQRRRKHRPVGEFDLPGDASDHEMHAAASDDEDELSYLPSRRLRQGGESRTPRPLGNTRDKLKLNKQNRRKAKAKSAMSSRPSEPATYSHSRETGVDKENDLVLSSPSSSPLSSPPDSDLTDSETEGQPSRRYMSEELRAAAKKFAEVDQWQMEFEEVSASEA